MSAGELMRRAWLVGAAAALVAGCAAPLQPVLPSEETLAPPVRRMPSTEPARSGDGQVLARNERLLVYLPAAGETLRSIAARWLGREDRDWEIAELNGLSMPEAGQPLVVPLQPINLPGVGPGVLQTVPILSYHRLGWGGGRLTVSPTQFAQQLDWLARNGYRVVRLSQVQAFMEGRERLPPRSVVITIDDGYESAHRVALPLLRHHGFPATVFVVSDTIGVGDALSWTQLRELVASGLIEIGAHSKTHRNLTRRAAGDGDAQYRRDIELELRAPRELLERQLGVPVRHFAFPYGDANAQVLEVLLQQPYSLAVTVSAGGNPFYAQPLLLRRTMIFGDHDLATFQSKLQVSRPIGLP
jgi:peptidoglycan/xylan/chitin deacetylase (PgdA/CDA1 family)